jgi:hypothetical protein
LAATLNLHLQRITAIFSFTTAVTDECNETGQYQATREETLVSKAEESREASG